MPSIPDFNYNNVIPPHLGNPTDSNRISPYKADILDFCHKFATSTERIEILKGFVTFRLEALKYGIKDGFQWIDVSFSENIEKSEKRAPNDIDVVSFIPSVNSIDVANISKNFIAFIYPKISKDQYKVDHYIVEFDRHPISTIHATKYWIQLFSHNRNGVWKGMIEIPIYKTPDKDNDALTYLNSI